MSTITLNLIESSASPEDIHHNNLQFFKTNFSDIISGIDQAIKNLDPELVKDNQMVARLQSLAKAIINEYTLSVDISGQTELYITTNTVRFNEEALKVKIQVRSLELETTMANNEYEALFNKQKRILSKLPPADQTSYNTRISKIQDEPSLTRKVRLSRVLLTEMSIRCTLYEAASTLKTIKKCPPGFQAEYNLLCNALKSIISERNLEEKGRKAEDLSERIHSFNSQLQIAQTIDISKLTEHKINITTSNSSLMSSLLLPDINRYYRWIEGLDLEVAQKLQPLIEESHTNPHKQNLIRTEFQVQYGQLLKRIAESQIIHEELQILGNRLRGVPGSEHLLHRISLLMQDKYPDPRHYNTLQLEANDHIRSSQKTETKVKDVIPDILKILEHLGYSVKSNTLDLTVNLGEEIYLDTTQEQYKLKLQRRETGEILYRLIRVVPSEKETQSTIYQEQKDFETGKKWCRDYDTLTEELLKAGICQKATMRLEPEDEPVRVEVRTDLVQEKKKKETLQYKNYIKP